MYRPLIERTTCVKLHSHFRFDQLSTRLTLELFAEKPIHNLASISFCTYRVRGKQRRTWVRHTNSMQFVMVEELQKSDKSRNCRNHMQWFNLTLLRRGYYDHKMSVSSLLLNILSSPALSRVYSKRWPTNKKQSKNLCGGERFNLGAGAGAALRLIIPYLM